MRKVALLAALIALTCFALAQQPESAATVTAQSDKPRAVAGQPEPESKPRPKLDAADLAVYEATVRFQVKKWNRYLTHCIKVDDQDPSDAFLKKLEPLRLKKASACRGEYGPPAGSVILSSKIRFRGKFKALVEGGMYCSPLCAESGDFHLIWDGEHWVVTRFELKWIS